jgi:hypothetical protein
VNLFEDIRRVLFLERPHSLRGKALHGLVQSLPERSAIILESDTFPTSRTGSRGTPMPTSSSGHTGIHST